MAATTYPMCLDAAIHVKFIDLPQPYPVGLDDKLQLYFQSSRKSGGGDIENMYIYTQDDDPFAVIIFDKPETAHNVLARRNHVFVINNQKIELLVEAATGASGIEEVHTGESGPELGNSPPPLLMSPAHSDDMYGSEPASDINPSAENHDNDHHQQPLHLHQGDRSSDQQVKVRQECEKHQEQEPRLTSTVPDVDSPLNTSTIPDVDSPLNATSDHLVNEGGKPQQLLEVFFEKLSLDTVLMYFESKRHSGGGAIANHELLQLGNVLIIFEQAGVAEHVSTRRHQLEGQTLDVSLIEETSPGPNTIEVNGFASKIGVETLEMYFESKRRSGGGDIMECSMNEDRSKFTIKFAEAEVVEKVIHRVHEIENTKLTVKRPGKVRYRTGQGKRLSRIGVDFAIPPSEDVHILVCFHKKMSLDMVLMYFESKKHSGGGDISNHELLQRGNLVITFQKPGVAEHVCTKQHKLEGQTLNVSVIEETGPAPNTIEVSGFASKIGEETLEMYFESKRRSGGGDITESSMNEDRSKFTITFANEGVVDRILVRDHELNGTSLNVHRPQKVWQYKHHVDKSVVEVHGVPRNTSTDLLQMYFESGRSGGDGSEVKVMYHENTNVWTVKFDNPEIADRVLEKSHRLNKKDIKVSRPQPKSIVSGKCTTTDTDGKQEDKEIVPLEVEDAKSSISEELLRMYFESPEKSGGGPIDLMQKNQKVIGSWTIHFHDSGVAQKVAGQKLHELSGSRLKVRLGKKRARRPLLDRCLLISGLPKNVNEEIFHLYLEKVTSKKAPIIKFGRDPSKAMVIYTDPIQDIDDVIARIEDQKLQSTKINAKRVFEVDTIIVKNLDKSSTEEMLKLYFENHGRSGGGKINDMQLEKKRSEVTIQFENYTVVKSVFKQKHQLQKKEIEVCPYYDEIGEFMSDGCQWKPDPVPMHADPYLLTFALMTQTCRDNFSTAGIQIECNPDSPGILKLHAVEGDALDLRSITDWEDYAASNFKRFFSDQFELKTLDIGDECFEEFQKYSENDVETQGVKLILDDSSPSLMILGLKDAVETVWDQLSHKLKTMKDEIKRRESIITQTKTYKPIKIKQIHLLEFEEAAMSNHGVKVMVDDHSNTVSFEGLPDDIKNADLGLYKELENLTEVSFPCDAEICKFLIDFYDEIIRVHKGNNLHFAYEIEGSRVKIYSTTDQDGKAARSSIEGMIKHHKYPLPGDKMKVMKSSDGKQLLDGLKSHGYITVEIVDQEEAASCIMVTGFDMAVKKVVSQIDDFVGTNQILEKKKGLERGMVRLLDKHHSEELASIESALNKYFVKLKPIDGKSCILIRGNRSGIDKAMESIIVLESKVQTGKHLISQPGMASFFKEDKGRRALESVETHCKCIIEVDGSYISAAPMQISLRHRLQRGIELIVCKADMTQMKVDVIVNAANDRLQHVGGLAKAIVDAGGREIQEESDKIMAGRKALVSGEVIVTDAGKLPCKKIIHTVGPKCESGQVTAKLKRLLMYAVTGAYEEAEIYGFTSIGMPAISSGIYGYPLKLCTQAILKATEEYFKDNPRSKIEQVYFLSVDMKVCKEFESSMETLFKVVRDEDDVVRLVSDDSDDSNDSDDFDDLTGAAAMQTSSRPGLKIKNDVVTTREGFDISLIKGKIEDSKADVIVNTTSGDLNLNSGNVSKALLMAAGSQLQQECDNFKANGGKIPLKGYVETGPAALNCRKVFHTSSNHYQGPGSMKNMRELLRILLSSASGMRSIVIPALGTGNLQYPADVVAKIMYEEAIAFSAKNSQSSLRDIKFVVFYKDLKTVQAFENEIKDLKFPTNKDEKKLKKRLKPKKTQDAVDHGEKGFAKRRGHPTVSSPYTGFRKIDQQCAQMMVAGITVTIQQGDITKDDADAIVNLTSGTFDLSAGAVSKAILKAGGKSIQKECYINIKSPTDEVWTGPGRLKCGGICHVPNTGDLGSLKSILVRVLRTAEQWGKGTLAFPAIGTGAISISSKESAMFILDCICSFAMKGKPTNLRNIRIIVFETPMTYDFISVMKEMEGKPFQQKGFLQKGFDLVKSWVGVGGGETTDDSPISTTLTLKILALNDEHQIQAAKGRIQSIISDETTEKTIHNEVFSRFGKGNFMKKLKEIGAKHEVVVDTTNIRLNTVELHGRSANVVEAQDDVFGLISKIKDEEREQTENELILKDVKWYYAGDVNEMEEFDDQIVLLLEKAYKKKERKVKYDAANNHTYEVDLKSMKEKDLKSKRTIDVTRRDLNVGQNLPPIWSPMTASDKLKVVDLRQGQEYQKIEQQFTASLAGQYGLQSIVKISRIQNIELWKQYAAKKEAFEKSMPGKTVERVLYHGTDESTIDKINNGGFNRSYAGKNAVMFGAGTYFAGGAGYSARDQYSKPNAKGEKHIFLCHVLVGEYTTGQQGMLAPPQQPTSIDLYHSVVDNPANPSIFVIFNDVQAYPSYLITFN